MTELPKKQRNRRRYPQRAVLDHVQAAALVKYNDTLSPVRPVELLDRVYVLIKQDIDRLTAIGTLTEAQVRLLHSHLRALNEAAKEQRMAEAEAAAKAKKMTDSELVEALRKLPKETLHKILTILAQETANE